MSLSVVSERRLPDGSIIRICDDYAAAADSDEFEAIEAEQREVAGRILRNSARRKLGREDYDMGDVPGDRRSDFDDCGCRVRDC